MNELKRLGAKVVSPVKIKKPSEYTFEGKSSYQVIRCKSLCWIRKHVA